MKPGVQCAARWATWSAQNLPSVTRGIWGDPERYIEAYWLGPAEVEGAMREHPAVAEAAAIGVPDEIKGEGIVEIAVLKKDQQASWNSSGISPVKWWSRWDRCFARMRSASYRCCPRRRAAIFGTAAGRYVDVGQSCGARRLSARQDKAGASCYSHRIGYIDETKASGREVIRISGGKP